VQQFVPEFAQAAQRLERAGQHSPVERTSFGYHVLRALRIIPPRQPALEERRKLLRAEVVEQRAREQELEILGRQRKQTVVEQVRSALGSMEGLGTSR
jgi:parvulin-like peptidyl-prolyl isomerase